MLVCSEKKPVIILGGGIKYAKAQNELKTFLKNMIVFLGKLSTTRAPGTVDLTQITLTVLGRIGMRF